MTKLTKEALEALIIEEHYLRPGNGTLTICVLTVKGGTTVLGESNVLNPNNFDADIGKKMAREDAIDKMWSLEGYRIKRNSGDVFLRAAMAAHEANRALQIANGEEPSPHWHEAPDWMRQSIYSGVLNIARDPAVTPATSHENWLADREANGWVWGEIKNEQAKTHPCMVPFEELPPEQQAKDIAFVNVVRAALSI